MAYSTADQVRAVLPSLLTADDEIGEVPSGTNLKLNYPAVAVPTILKNSTTLAITTDYTFVRSTKITLSVAAAGEYFTAQIHRGATDTELEVIVAKADRIIDDFVVHVSAPSSGYLQDWSSELSASMYLRQYALAVGGPDDITTAQTMEDRVFQLMQNYINKTGMGTYDDSGISRDDATSVSAFQLDQQTVQDYET